MAGNLNNVNVAGLTNHPILQTLLYTTGAIIVGGPLLHLGTSYAAKLIEQAADQRNVLDEYASRNGPPIERVIIDKQQKLINITQGGEHIVYRATSWRPVFEDAPGVWGYPNHICFDKDMNGAEEETPVGPKLASPLISLVIVLPALVVAAFFLYKFFRRYLETLRVKIRDRGDTRKRVFLRKRIFVTPTAEKHGDGVMGGTEEQTEQLPNGTKEDDDQEAEVETKEQTEQLESFTQDGKDQEDQVDTVMTEGDEVNLD